MDANGENKIQLTYMPIDERSPLISPDGKDYFLPCFISL